MTPKNILSRKITSNISQKKYKIPSVKFAMEMSENHFGFEHTEVCSDINSTLIFKEVRKEVEEYLLGESDDTDSTDGVFDFLATLSEKVQEEFDELLDGDSDKNRFLRVLTRIFTLLFKHKGRHVGENKKNT